MAYITNSKTLFFVTSPRDANQLPDEIKVLIDHFSGQVWNPASQELFYQKLSEYDFFNGTLTGDLAFKARDRINRSPQSLGLVNLKPTISITDAGRDYLHGQFQEERLLKQMLKFQLPSIYHIDNSGRFRVKPYLELIRFINDFEGLTKVEIALYVTQLVDNRNYEVIKNKISSFRSNRRARTDAISYNRYVDECFERELRAVYADEIASNELSTRESSDASISNFLATKKNNLRDYADASIRYLRATGLFTFDPSRNKVKVLRGKEDDVNYLLEHTDRTPLSFATEEEYKQYLFSASNIQLLSDDKSLILDRLANFTHVTTDLQCKNLVELKELAAQYQKQKVEEITENEIDLLKNYEKYDEVVDIYEKLSSRDMVDKPLYLEWNTWRAFNMLDDGKIEGNFIIDDEGLPLYTAAGNKPDIECEYRDFDMIVEVTMSSGNRQYEMEGEPVARHLGIKSRNSSKDVYCIFIAPTVSEATLAHYYAMHKTSIAYYGGVSKIIPLDLDAFKSILRQANASSIKPTSEHMKNFVTKATELAQSSDNEIDWFEQVKSESLNCFSTASPEITT
jgi:hypothetical protein